MKKALALVLALVLALSMAVSSFALTLVELEDQSAKPAGKKVIEVVDANDTYLHVYEGGKYYVALEDEPWENVKITANGCVSAKLIDFDPEKMVIVDEDGKDIVRWAVVDKKGDIVYDAMDLGDGKTRPMTYDEAVAAAKDLNDADRVTYFKAVCLTNVFVIEIVVEDNYTTHFEEGTINVEATLNKKPYAGKITVVNDVIIFEYEEVKWAAANSKTDALYVGDYGYSDWFTDEHGYSSLIHGETEYDPETNRAWEDAAVVSTTAFRAIAGKDLVVKVAGEETNVGYYGLKVTLKEIAKDQKGVNFLGYVDIDYVDENGNGKFDLDKENYTSIDFGFCGDQVVKGDFVIDLTLPIDYYELRELFGVKVEEDDIISYYLVDANGKVVGGKEVDYMTADLNEEVSFTVKGSNSKLGEYKIVLEVPAAEGGEENPNTGAESVVGVVAALAVVSVATAAAVSLKK